MLTHIDFLSSVRTFMFEVMEMSEDFPYCLKGILLEATHPIQSYSLLLIFCFGAALECVKASLSQIMHMYSIEI
jgi:hypothetical protein